MVSCLHVVKWQLIWFPFIARGETQREKKKPKRAKSINFLSISGSARKCWEFNSFFFFVCNTNYIQGGISHLANVKSKFHASVLFNLCDPSFSCHHLLENFSMKYDNSQRQIRVLKNYTHFFKITVKTCLKGNLVAF